MQAHSRKTYAWLVQLGILVALLIAAGSCSTLPQNSTQATPTTDATSDRWTATFEHTGLDRAGTLTAAANTCRLALAGSSPSTIVLDRIVDQPTPAGKRIRVYAGWPRNASGQISGVHNQSPGPAQTRVEENKLGPTIVWAIGGCGGVCVKGMLLRYDMAITRGDTVIPVVRIDSPTADSCAQPAACLAPAFRAAAEDNSIAVAGAIDQPGCTISRVGDGFRDLGGNYDSLKAGDRLSITFKQRTFILCDDEIIAVTDWGYRLTADAGQTADQITPHIDEDVQVELLLKDDPDPIKRARFARAVATASGILEFPSP